MTNIKAIETQWKGYRFRSRLEARWAVFFEALGIRWEYEPQGFETRAGKYLPDFFLPEFSMWAEVKPSQLEKRMSEAESDKALWFVCDGREPLVILDGVPADRPYRVITPASCCAYGCEEDFDPFVDVACQKCLDAGVAINNAASDWVCWVAPGKRIFPKEFGPRLHWGADSFDAKHVAPDAAINAARSARFEHGEAPA